MVAQSLPLSLSLAKFCVIQLLEVIRLFCLKPSIGCDVSSVGCTTPAGLSDKRIGFFCVGGARACVLQY